MQESQNAELNSVNRGFIWMLGEKSNNKKEEQVFNYTLEKSVSFFGRKFQVSISFKKTKNLPE